MTEQALIVVDMQNAFLHPEGSLARLGQSAGVDKLRAAIPGSAQLVDDAKRANIPTIFVRHTLRPDYQDGGLLFNEISGYVRSEGFIVRGTWDSEIVDELVVGEEDFVIEKPRFSAFYGTSLESLLASLRVREVVIAGVTTNICVESTARDASQRNLRTLVVGDAVAEMDDAKHEHALSTLGTIFCRVVGLEETLERWSSEIDPAHSRVGDSEVAWPRAT